MTAKNFCAKHQHAFIKCCSFCAGESGRERQQEANSKSQLKRLAIQQPDLPFVIKAGGIMRGRRATLSEAEQFAVHVGYSVDDWVRVYDAAGKNVFSHRNG